MLVAPARASRLPLATMEWFGHPKQSSNTGADYHVNNRNWPANTAMSGEGSQAVSLDQRGIDDAIRRLGSLSIGAATTSAAEADSSGAERDVASKAARSEGVMQVGATRMCFCIGLGRYQVTIATDASGFSHQSPNHFVMGLQSGAHARTLQRRRSSFTCVVSGHQDSTLVLVYCPSN